MAAEIAFNVFLGLIMALFLVQALQLPATGNPSDILGAGGFPVILGILGLIVLAAITIRVIREQRSVKIPLFELGTADGRALALNIALLLTYILLLDVIGFVLSTMLYLPLAGFFIGYRKAVLLGIYTIAVTATVTVVFGILFVVPLPRGIGTLRELSYLIY